MKLGLNSPKKILMVSGVATSILLVVAVVYLDMFRQISTAQAEKACQELFRHAELQVASVPGYKIIHERKSCDNKKDEVGFTDYTFYVYFRVSNNSLSDNNSVTEIKNNINYLQSKLPRKDHWLWLETRNDYTLRVVNEPPLNGQPETYCITTARYLDHSGMYMEQDPSRNRGGYIKPGSIPGYDPCSE